MKTSMFDPLDLAEQTMGTSKTADGLRSLEWVRQGRMDLVEKYCRADVRITNELFQHGLSRNWLRCTSRDGRLMEMALDWDLEALVRKRNRM